MRRSRRTKRRGFIICTKVLGLFLGRSEARIAPFSGQDMTRVVLEEGNFGKSEKNG